MQLQHRIPQIQMQAEKIFEVIKEDVQGSVDL